MTPEIPLPQMEYLIECPDSAISNLELKLLDLYAQCMKRAKSEMDQAEAYREGAGVCRWLIENRDGMINVAKRIADGKQGILRFPELAHPAEAPVRRSA
jgi:hypothetical protein